jgi:hypothetical protein
VDIEGLAKKLQTPVDVVKSAMAKCIKSTRLKTAKGEGDEIIAFITGWQNYQPTFDQSIKKAVYNKAPKMGKLFTDSPLEEKNIEKNIEKKKEGALPPAPLTTKIIDILEVIMEILRPIKAKGFKIHASWLASLIQEFPEIDHIEQVRKKVAWWNDHPLTKKSNVHLQLLNWFTNARKYEAQQKKERMVGQTQPAGPSKKAADNFFKALEKEYGPKIEEAKKSGKEDFADYMKNEAQVRMDKFLKALMNKEKWALEWADK